MQTNMVKLFSPGDWQNGFGEEDNQIKIASGGLKPADKQQAKRFADEQLLHWLSQMPTDGDCVYVHKVAMSGSHRYGPNRWGDGFREEVLKRDVPTFEQYAKAFRNHKSNDGVFYGRPKIARLRDDLGTVELVTEYYGTDKVAAANGGKVADLELQALSKNGYIPVSMGSNVPGGQCFPAGTQIAAVDGLIAIEQLKVGQSVFTHKGRLRRIRKTGQRVHTGEMVSIKPRNHLRPLKTSDEHPYYILRCDAVRQPAGRRRSDLSCVSPEWVPAKDVRAGDFVLSPTWSGEVVDSNELAKVFGYFAGNGSRIIQRTGRKKDGPHRLMGFSISGNLNQPEIMQEASQAIEAIAENSPTLRVAEERNAYDLRTYDQRLATRLVTECGPLCHEKIVPAYLFAASMQERLAFIGALIDADGSVDVDTGAIRIPLSNELLVSQTYLLALTCGIRGSVGQYVATAGFSQEKPEDVTCLFIAASHFDLLSSYSWKVSCWGKSRRSGGVAFTYEHANVQYVAIEVESVQVEIDEQVVYNLSVEEDESYVAEGIAVHNCVICGHWAKTRKEHCLSKKEGGSCELFGCRNNMLKIASDGRQQYVDNPYNVFYDISFVRQGADPVATGLLLPLGMFDPAEGSTKKVAEFSEKLAEFVPQEINETASMTARQRAAMQLCYVWSEMEQKYASAERDYVDIGLQMRDDISDAMSLMHTSRSHWDNAIRCMADFNVCPTFFEFAKSAGYSDGEIKVAQRHVPMLFTTLVAQKLIPQVIPPGKIEKNGSEYFVKSKLAGKDVGSSQSEVIRRGLRGNAESRRVAEVKQANFDESLPKIVVDFARCKLAWASQADLDYWTLQQIPRREFSQLEKQTDA